MNKLAGPLSRQDEDIHWLHGLSIMTATLSAAWGILALVLTFGSTLAATVTDQGEVAGYFMVILGVAYSLYLTLRYLFGLAGRPDLSTAKTSTTIPTALDSNSLFNALRVAAATPSSNIAAAAQPSLFSGGGAAAFGGLDLSGFQPSSLTTTTSQRVGACAMGGGQPMGGGYAQPVMMMMPQQQPMMMAYAPQQMTGGGGGCGVSSDGINLG